MIERRQLLVGAAAFGAMLSIPGIAAPARAFGESGLRRKIAGLEKESGGRLGVALLDTGSGRRFGWRADERFPMCSTFKFLLVAALLARVDRGAERLDRRFAIPAALPSNSPFTRARAGRHATLSELCGAAIALSDNGAGNLLLAAIGGPAGLTRFARTLGDPVTRLDRTEPALNQGRPGDPRDTTSPRAMAGDFERLLLGPALRAPSAARLRRWLLESKTGPGRLRAGFPPGWRVGHKTGTGMKGIVNDVAIAWPRDRAPLIVAAYLTEASLDDPGCEKILAALGRAIAAELA